MDLDADILEHLHRQFLKKRNPLYAWEAYLLTRRRPDEVSIDERGEVDLTAGTPRPLPQWVAEYFDQCADALLYGECSEVALQLATRGGGHGKYRQWANESRNSEILEFVNFWMRLKRNEVSEEDIFLGPWKDEQRGA